MELYTSGTALDVWRDKDAVNSWYEAVAKVANQKRDAQEAQLAARLALLAERGWLRSPEQFNDEGQEIYAVKTTGGLRAYGWFTNIDGKRAFVIGYVTLKKAQRLDVGDRNKAIAARTRFERRH